MNFFLELFPMKIIWQPENCYGYLAAKKLPVYLLFGLVIWKIFIIQQTFISKHFAGHQCRVSIGIHQYYPLSTITLKAVSPFLPASLCLLHPQSMVAICPSVFPSAIPPVSCSLENLSREERMLLSLSRPL